MKKYITLKKKENDLAKLFAKSFLWCILASPKACGLIINQLINNFLTKQNHRKIFVFYLLNRFFKNLASNVPRLFVLNNALRKYRPRMKKIYFRSVGSVSLLVICLTLVIQSCKKGSSFLAATSTNDLTEASVFGDSVRTEGFLANIYSNIAFSAARNRFGRGGLDAACDEAEPSAVSGSNTASQFATGTVNASVITDNVYNTCYTQIRAVNVFLKDLPKTPMAASVKVQRVAEARFLRAWYYSILLKHYGGVPLVGDTLYTFTSPINVVRSTYDACVKYVVAECDAAALVLPTIQTALDYGRISKGACLALKARVLLYAASPLFNGTTLVAEAGGSAPANPSDPTKPVAIAAPEIVGYPAADPNRWRLAEDAAAAVIALGVHSLNLTPPAGVAATVPGAGFQGLFPQRSNPEFVFARLRGGNTTDCDLFLPPSRGSNGQGAFPYQEMVDAFPMANGKPITDPTSGYDANNPYANRDPRMNYSIIHDQTVLLVRTGTGQPNGSAPVKIYSGNFNGVRAEGDTIPLGTRTGYYNNKMLDPAGLAATLYNATNSGIPLIRYAEVLLNYAEAGNEFEGPTQQVYDAINAVRQRAGLNPYQLPTGLDKNAMRTYIQNERRIELAYEEHRFWDVRRWKIAPTTENIQATGLRVIRNGAAVSYQRFNLTKHNFRPAMYLWPFPLAETGKSSTLAQNPGY